MNITGPITGRDGYILAKALAYAIAAIEALPQERQEYSDCQDMKKLLEATGLQNVVQPDVDWHMHGKRDPRIDELMKKANEQK